MLSRIKYVYDKDNENNNKLLGAKVFMYDGDNLMVQEIYVGIELELEDVLNNKVNAQAIGVKNLRAFNEKYNSVNAKGVIYFPQVDDYSFLEETDQVIPYKNENIMETLSPALEQYRQTATNEALEKKLKDQRDYVAGLDPEDSLLELYGYSLSRQRTSRR